MLSQKEKKQIGRDSARKYWGLRGKFACSIFPIKGKYRLTISYWGKEFTWVGESREVLIDNLASNLIDALNPTHHE